MALEFEIKLSDGVSAAAGSAAHQVDILTKQMRGLQTAMIKANALGNEKAFQKAANDYQRLGKEVDKLGGRVPKVTEATKKKGDAFKNTAMEMNAYLELAKKLGEVLQRVGETISETVIGVYKLGAARAQLGATFTALGAGKVAGDDVLKMLDGLGDVLPYTRDEMASWSKIMMTAGITDLPRLEQATKAAAASSAIMGDETGKAGEKITNMIVQFQDAIKMRQGISDLRMELRGTGITSDEVAAKMGITEKQLQAMAASGRNLSKIGDAIQDALIRKGIEPMRKMNASWETISKKLKDNIAKIFDGLVGTEGFKQFANALQVLVLSFSQTTNSGKHMKGEMIGMFDAIFRSAAKFVEYLTLGLIYAQIEWYKLKIAMKPITRAIGEIVDTFKGFFIYKDEITGATKTTKYFDEVLRGLKIVFVAVSAAVGALVFGIVFLSTAFLGLVSAIERCLEPLADLGARAAKWGEDVIFGFIDGLLGNQPKLVNAGNTVADQVQNAIKNKLKMRSPSRVMMQLGAYTAEGMALGMEKSTPRVESAAEGMSTVAVKGAAPSGATPAGGGVTVNLAAGAIQIAGGGGADLMKLTEEAVVSLFERVALTQGVA